jgi:hypothetical protein
MLPTSKIKIVGNTTLSIAVGMSINNPSPKIANFHASSKISRNKVTSMM